MRLVKANERELGEKKMKKGKNRKGLIIVLVILLIIAGAGIGYCYLTQAYAADENKELILEEGQEYTYGKITSILGNEIEYIVVDAQTVDFSNSDEKISKREERSLGEKKRSQMQDRETTSAKELTDNIEGVSTTDTISKMRNMSPENKISSMESMPMTEELSNIEEMPEMDMMPSANEMPDRNNADKTGRSGVQQFPVEADDIQKDIIMTYIETDATGQMQIPVGTEVETKLGTITTFSRLSNGDIIKMLLQRDNTGNKTLMKIWIVE